jgi:hypothetical protein
MLMQTVFGLLLAPAIAFVPVIFKEIGEYGLL